MYKELVLVCLLGCVLIGVLGQPLTSPEAEQWQHFKNKYGKSYSTEDEEAQRRQIFVGHLRTIEEHNKQYQRGEKTFDLKINQFADLSNEEFRQRMNGYRHKERNGNVEVYTPAEGETLPSSVDWRPKGAVTPIKDQAQCGSCWAFSATGSLEGQHFLKNGKLVSLSEQNLMDCSESEGNEGCNGGLMDQAFEYIKENGGIDTEESYPYQAYDGSCRFKKANVGATLKSYKDIKANSESDLQSAIANVGPISVAIDAGHSSFQFYNTGIYYESSCSPYYLDHGVLAVGYGSNEKGDYYIVKNSWGESWGSEGYLLMSRNKDNNCGIATEASYPVV